MFKTLVLFVSSPMLLLIAMMHPDSPLSKPNGGAMRQQGTIHAIPAEQSADRMDAHSRGLVIATENWNWSGVGDPSPDAPANLIEPSPEIIPLPELAEAEKLQKSKAAAKKPPVKKKPAVISAKKPVSKVPAKSKLPVAAKKSQKANGKNWKPTTKQIRDSEPTLPAEAGVIAIPEASGEAGNDLNRDLLFPMPGVSGSQSDNLPLP